MSGNDIIANEKTTDTIVRNFEIIGEAASRIPDNFKTDHPEIERRRMTGLRAAIMGKHSCTKLFIFHKICGKKKILGWY